MKTIMNSMIDWMTNVLSPKLSKITQNVWVQALQESFQIIMPFILLGSIMSLLKNLRGIEALSWLPYSDTISNFSFGLMGLMVVFLIPYLVLKKKGFDSQSTIAGFTGLSSYMIFCMPIMTKEGLTAFAGSFSASGLFVALIVGMLSAAIILPFLRHKFVKDDGVIPAYIANWFNTLVPVALVIIISTVLTEGYQVNLFSVLADLFAPILTMGQSYLGFMLCYFVMIFLFAFGVNAWAVAAVAVPIWNMGIQANIDAIAAGGSATAINTTEVIFNGWLNIGGLGCTLPLVIFALISKSKRLKQVGKAVAIPAVFNINEPTIYGLPIAWNPLLMIPFILNAIIAPTIVYVTLTNGLCNIPSQLYQMSFLPTGINAYFVSNDFRGVILWAVVFIVTTLVYYPFWKAYEKQEIDSEQQAESCVNTHESA